MVCNLQELVIWYIDWLGDNIAKIHNEQPTKNSIASSAKQVNFFNNYTKIIAVSQWGQWPPFL